MTRARDLAAGTFELATGGVLKLETSDTTVTDGSVLGKIEFKAPDEASGTDANLTAAAIEAVAEGTFAADNNATELVFKTGASAAADAKMRIDSSGNVLVGKATLGISTNGFDVRPTGETGISVDSNIVLDLNRTTNDGKIINLRKDGTTVGSIQSRAGVVSTIVLDPRSGGGGLTGGGAALYPTDNAGSPNDGYLTLGDASNRFKDLYLSGGVYLGGTGAANKLDDYEEGTWTAGVSGGTTVRTNATGYYTKIGNVVTFSYYTGSSNLSSASGGMIITGLPFTASNGSSFNTAIVVAHNTFFGGSATVGQQGYVGTNGTSIYMVTVGTATTSTFTNGNGKYLMISGTYYTSS